MTRDDDELLLLIVDGDNVLHRLRGGRDGSGLAWLLPRLRATLPAGGRGILMLDGHPSPGQERRSRVAPGVEVHHSGRIDGDGAILELVAALPFAERGRTAVVTDDRSLADRARHLGALTRRLDWLRLRLERPDAVSSGKVQQRRPTSLGHSRPPPGLPSGAADEHTREPWRPGRGATRKRGNPRRRSP